jgi:hypothetical protein
MLTIKYLLWWRVLSSSSPRKCFCKHARRLDYYAVVGAARHPSSGVDFLREARRFSYCWALRPQSPTGQVPRRRERQGTVLDYASQVAG